MRRFPNVLPALVVALGLAICGCKGGSGSPTAPPKGPPAPPTETPATTSTGGPKATTPARPTAATVESKPKDKVEAPRDPAVAAVEARKGRVVRDEAQPDKPVVEVDLTFTKTTDADLKPLAAFKKLRKLNVSQNPGLTGTGFKDLAGLSELESLNASGTGLSDEGMKYVAELKGLKVLDVGNTKIGDAGMRAIAKLAQLQDLTAGGLLLNGPNKDEPSDAAVSDLGKLKQLRRLVLDNSNFGDASAKAFGGLDQLKVLLVYGTKVTDAGLEALAKLKQLEELRVGYRVGDKGVNALKGNTRLKVLSLWNCTDVGDGSVKALTTLTGLRELDVGSTRISANGQAEIRKALPECKVSTKR